MPLNRRRSVNLLNKTVKETLLLREPIEISSIIPGDFPFVRANMTIDRSYDLAARRAMVHLRAYLLKGTHQEMGTEYLKAPATWWQHFKESCFPAWLLERFPVEYTKRAFTYQKETRLCPHGNFAWGDNSHISFLSFDDAKQFGTEMTDEWWNRYNKALTDFDPSYLGWDLTEAVFHVINRAKIAEFNYIDVKSQLDFERKSREVMGR